MASGRYKVKVCQDSYEEDLPERVNSLKEAVKLFRSYVKEGVLFQGTSKYGYAIVEIWNTDNFYHELVADKEVRYRYDKK